MTVRTRVRRVAPGAERQPGASRVSSTVSRHVAPSQPKAPGVSRVPEVSGRDSVLSLQRTVGNQQTASWISGGVQREPDDDVEQEGKDGPDPLDAGLKAIADAPEVPEESVLAPEVVEQAKDAGKTLGEELSIAKGKPELGNEFEESIGQSEESDEIQGLPEGLEALESYQDSLNGGETKPEQKGEASEPGPMPSNKWAKRFNSMKKWAKLGGNAAKYTMKGIRKAGATTASVASVLAWVGAGLGAVFALLNVRSAISSKLKGDELEKVYANLKAQHPEDAGLLDAVHFAIRQKYSKALTRAVKAITGIVGTGIGIGALVAGVGLFALASNPVGWVIAGIIVGAITAVGTYMALRRLSRKIYKWWRGDLGLERRKFAMRLYDKMIARDGNATAAVASLGLDPAKMQQRAAQPETEESQQEREGGKGFNKVAKEQGRHLEQMAEAKNAAEVTRALVEERRAELVEHEAALRMGVKDIREWHHHRERAFRIPGEITSLKKQLELYEKQGSERERQAGQDQVKVEWKSHPRSQREDIKLIERKLKR